MREAVSRVALSPLPDEESEDVAAAMGANVRDAARLLAVTRRRDGERIGVVGYRLDYPQPRWLAFEPVTVEESPGGRGLAEEAVRLVEDEALTRGEAERFWAEVPREEGLRLYFWLRLGYRPAHREDICWLPGGSRGTFAMIRVPQ